MYERTVSPKIRQSIEKIRATASTLNQPKKAEGWTVNSSMLELSEQDLNSFIMYSAVLFSSSLPQGLGPISLQTRLMLRAE